MKIYILSLLIFLFAAATTSATTYYVDATSGSDSNAGMSHAAAWQTLAKVNSTVSGTGDDVYLLCGETWTGEQLTVDWAGTSGDRVVIGAYYMDGSETIGVNGDGKPVIDGSDTVPSYDTHGLVRPNGVDYVTIQDLEVKNSAGDGVEFNNSDYGTVQRCKIHNTYRSNIDNYDSSYTTVEYNECYEGAEKWVSDGYPSSWPCGGIRLRDGSNSTARYNYVYHQWGEGIDIGESSIIKYNLIVDTQSQGLYVQAVSNCEVAYNIVLGTDETTYENGTTAGWHGSGITLRIESGESANVRNNKIHHNVVVGTYAGFRISNQQDEYDFEGNYLYNNTFINNRHTIHANNNSDDIDDAIYYQNNISHEPNIDHVYAVSGLDNWTFGYNCWHGGDQPGSPFSGNTGDQTDDPTFGKDVWRGTTPTVADLTMSNLLPTAVAEDNGTDLGQGYQNGLNPDSTDFTTTDPDANQDPIIVGLANQDEHGSGWDIGAIIKTYTPETQNVFYGAGRQASQHGAGRQSSSYGAGVQ